MMEAKEIKIQKMWHMKTKDSYNHRATKTYTVNKKKTGKDV